MKRILFLMALFVAATTMPMQSQINLKRLGKQIKQSAEQQVEQKIKEKASEEVREGLKRGEKKLDESVSSAVQSAKGEAKSEAAVSSNTDPMVSTEQTDQTADTRQADSSSSDRFHDQVNEDNIKAFYKTLDDKTYYEVGYYPEFYNLSKENSERINLDGIAVSYAVVVAEDNTAMALEDDKGRIVPLGEYTIHSGFASFSAMPKDKYLDFLGARTVLKLIREGKLNEDNKRQDIVMAKITEQGAEEFGLGFKSSHYSNPTVGGFPDIVIFDPFEKQYDKQKRIDRWNKEEARLMKLYKEQLSYEDVKKVVGGIIAGTVNFTKEKSWVSATLLSYYFTEGLKDLSGFAEKENDLEDYNLMVGAHDTWHRDNVPKWKAAVKREFHAYYEENINKKAGIPNAATSDPALEAEMIAIAKGIYDDGRLPVKAIIKYPDWNYTRNAFGAIIDRYHTAYIIFKMSDGSHRMVDIGFKQLYNGSSYGKTQLRGIGMINSTVDYK